MAYFQFKTTQHLPATLEEIWDFISSPKNLKEITPSYMGFDVLTADIPEKMYPGMIIAYKVSPVLNIPMTWVTEISQVSDKHFFVDEQRMGPYKMWHHQHLLEETDEGVLMTDIVTYIPPFGFLGKMANSLFIRKQLQKIFEHRFRVLEERYPKH